MANDILVIAEHSDGKIKKTTFELLSAGQDLAGQLGGALTAALIGSGVEGLAAELGHYGATKVFVADDAKLKNFSAEGYAQAAASIVKAQAPAAVLIGASLAGKDLGPRLAARLDAGLAADCVGLSVADGKLRARRPVFAGKAFANVEFAGAPQIISVRPNSLGVKAPDAGKTAETVKVDAGLGDVRFSLLEIMKAAEGKIELTEADIIVSGGRGMKGPENFHLVEGLAKALGAAVGASRAVVDAGWRPHSEQVGQTGKTVSPTLYIACGISGAIQHLAGMSSSKFIVAINKDPEAPIFKVADYGIVGDALEALPILTEEAKKLKAS